MNPLIWINKELTVLHIEDDRIDTLNMQRIFKKMDVPHRLLHASNGMEALELLRAEPHNRPNVILLDINMPAMNGLEFLKELRADPVLRPIMVFILSTSDYPRDVAIAYSHNVAGYLVKPTSSSKFSNIIESLLNLWAICEFPKVEYAK